VSVKGPLLILSIDGGGSRGAIPANVLYLLEREANIPIRETFDFFVGVSTGALLAGYCAADAGSIENLARHSYSSDNMSKIFDKTIWDKLLGRIQNQPKYDGVNKRRYIESLAKGYRINDIKDKHLLILAYDFISRELATFKNNRGHDSAYNPLLAEVLDAATAAPTLYPPVSSSAPKRRWFIDGALTTNDPSLCAITEALAMDYSLTDIWMISMGTGRPLHNLSQEDRDKIGKASQGWGIFGWISNGLLEHMMSASSCVSSHQCEQLLGDRYLRINGDLPRKLMQLDNTTETRVADLESYAFLWYEAHIERIRDLIDRVQAARAAHAEEAAAADPALY
jgi:uncharacterized protein